jgi:hypothetical protein
MIRPCRGCAAPTSSPGVGEPASVVDELWRPIAAGQLERVRRGEPLTHRLRELAGISRRSMALLGPIDSLLVDG